MKTTNAIVREALSRHIDREPSTIHAWQHLELDLFLSPHDLLLVLSEVAAVEDVEDDALAVDDWCVLSTVGDLFAFVSRRLAGQHRVHVLERVA
jgi:hypothetical protein